MSSAPSIYSSLILTILIAVLGTGCADDATRIERAKEHKAQAEYRAATIELKNILRLDPDNTEARTLLGQIALLNGDAATAIKELRRARELGAGPDLYAVDLARALLREGRYQEVVSLSPDLLSNTENRAALLALIGRAKLEQDDQQAASQNFAAALELVPDQSDALIGKAKLAEGQGDIAAAESSLTQMLQASPNDHQGLAALARVQYSKGDHVQAEQNFKKALDAIKGTGRAHERLMYMSGLLDAQLAQGKFTDAQAVGSNMIRVTSEHPVALLQAARADFAAKNYDGAIEKAERIITTLPTAEPPRMVLAAAAIAKRNTTLAATHLQAAININPENEIARKLLAQLRMQLGDPDEALEVLQPLMAAGTTDAQVLAMAGTASIRTGKTEIGVELVQRGMEMGVDDPAVALQAAANFLTAGELDRAIEVLESLPEADRVTQRELLLILALTKKGDIEGARTMAQAIVDASPELGESHRLMAAFHLSIDESDQARASLEKALQLNPDDTHSIMSLARLDITEQHPERAQARFNDVLKRRPGDLFALTALAELAEQRGAIDEGVALLEQAREANPESLVPILTLGRYYLRTGQLPLAEERANQAVRVSRSNGQSQMLLGMVMIEDGRSSEAIGHLERAIAAAPDLGAAHYHLGRAQLDSGLEEAGYKSLRRAIEVSPEDFRARAALAAAETKRGDFGAALAVVDGLISDYPDRKEPLVLKANIQVARKDLPAALELYEQAAKIEPSRELAARRFEIKRQLGMPQAWTELEEWV
ncbi:MAG: PEP-CTERM system TPR-repeat protein PrsT, partial [Gammaproteobacteria bacterium]|nr:PEP-CTERM system TPR-repeat protein PrsT [Gammaproteobacteria bacterium]